MKQRWYIDRISFRIVFPAIAGIVLYLAMLMVFGNLENLSGTFFSQEALFLVILSYINHEWAILMLGRKKSQEALGTGIFHQRLIYFLILLMGTALISTGIILVYFIFILRYYHFITELMTITILMVIFQLLVHIYYTGMMNIRRYHKLSIEKEEIQGRQLELELESFKSEMNPDLLMECLENLLTLINIDIRESDNYIQALSNQYRYMLDSRKKDFVMLDEEFEAGRELVYLLNDAGETRIQLEYSRVNGDVPLIPGTLNSIIYNVESTMILNSLSPLSLKLSLDKDGDIILSHPDRPRLVPGQTINMGKLNHSYMHFTNRGIDRRETKSGIEWVIPRLPKIVE